MHTHVVILNIIIVYNIYIYTCVLAFLQFLLEYTKYSMHGDQPLCYVNAVFVIVNAVDIKKLTANAQNDSRLILVHIRLTKCTVQYYEERSLGIILPRGY